MEIKLKDYEGTTSVLEIPKGRANVRRRIRRLLKTGEDRG